MAESNRETPNNTGKHIMHPGRKPGWELKFLKHFAKTGNITWSAKVAGVKPCTVYQKRKLDKEFAAAFEEAHEAANGVLERAAFERAVNGVERPVYQQGQMVGTVTEYSDNLLALLMKGRMPEKYDRVKAHEHFHSGVTQVIHSGEATLKLDLERLTPEEIHRRYQEALRAPIVMQSEPGFADTGERALPPGLDTLDRELGLDVRPTGDTIETAVLTV